MACPWPNPQPVICSHAPCTTHHAPCTMHHAPCTMHRAMTGFRAEVRVRVRVSPNPNPNPSPNRLPRRARRQVDHLLRRHPLRPAAAARAAGARDHLRGPNPNPNPNTNPNPSPTNPNPSPNPNQERGIISEARRQWLLHCGSVQARRHAPLRDSPSPRTRTRPPTPTPTLRRSPEFDPEALTLAPPRLSGERPTTARGGRAADTHARRAAARAARRGAQEPPDHPRLRPAGRGRLQGDRDGLRRLRP